ncbi:Tubulin/FtsZ family GTPase domain protein [Acanthocheilonema viteae]
MKEVINIQAGSSGNSIGTKFWEMIAEDHGIGPDGIYSGSSELQRGRMEVFFRETEENKHFPRAVVVDLESDSLNAVLQSTHRALFQGDNFVSGRGGTGNIWAKGFYGEGRRYIDEVLEVIRKEADICEGLQGFNVAHSLCGGTGSGFGALIIEKIHEQYPNRLISTFSTVSSNRLLGVMKQPYNTILSLQHLAENANITYCIDSDGLHDISRRMLRTREPNNDDLNHLASMVMSGITGFLRFPGQMDCDLRTLVSRMIPFPELHFLTPSFISSATLNTTAPSINVWRLVRELFHRRNMITTCGIARGHFFSNALAMIRGNISEPEVTARIWDVRYLMAPGLSPDNISLDIYKLPAHATAFSGTVLGNTTAVKDVLADIEAHFRTLFHSRVFLHYYTDEGMEETDFAEAGNYISNLVGEYANYDRIMDRLQSNRW